LPKTPLKAFIVSGDPRLLGASFIPTELDDIVIGYLSGRAPPQASFIPTGWCAPPGFIHSHRPVCPSGLYSFPPTCRRECRFRNQCAHWWRKHFIQSAGRPEIPQDFRPAQSLSFAMKRREADFHRLGQRAARKRRSVSGPRRSSFAL